MNLVGGLWLTGFMWFNKMLYYFCFAFLDPRMSCMPSICICGSHKNKFLYSLHYIEAITIHIRYLEQKWMCNTLCGCVLHPLVYWLGWLRVNVCACDFLFLPPFFPWEPLASCLSHQWFSKQKAVNRRMITNNPKQA